MYPDDVLPRKHKSPTGKSERNEKNALLVALGPDEIELIDADNGTAEACLMSASVGVANAFRRLSVTCIAGFRPGTLYGSGSAVSPIPGTAVIELPRALG